MDNFDLMAGHIMIYKVVFVSFGRMFFFFFFFIENFSRSKCIDI